MTLREKSPKLTPALVAVFAMSINACALSSDAYAENPKAVTVAQVSPPSQTPASLTATFLTITAVLAKLDRPQGRGRNAIRLASLRSSNTLTDAQSALTEAPARGGRAVRTVPVPRSRRFTLAQMAGRAERFDQRRKDSGALPGRR
jgi:hypothetical protein